MLLVMVVALSQSGFAEFLPYEVFSSWNSSGGAVAPIVIAAPLSIASLRTGMEYSNGYIAPGNVYQPNGRELLRSYSLFADWVNNVRGGILLNGVRRPVEIRLIEDHSDQGYVVQITQAFIAASFSFFLGPFSNVLNLEASPLVEASGGVMMVPGGDAAKIFEDKQSIFGLYPKGPVFNGIISYMAQQHGVSTLLAIQIDTVSGKALCKEVGSIALENGISHVETLTVNMSDRALWVKTYLKPLVDAHHPDMLTGCTESDSENDSLCRELLPAFRDNNINFKAMVFTECVTSQNFLEDLGPVAHFVMGVVPWMQDWPLMSDMSGWRPADFAIIYKNHYGRDPTYEAVAPFAAAVTLMQAIEDAQSIDPAVVASTLRTMNKRSLWGPVKFDEAGMLDSHFPAVQFHPDSSRPELVFSPDPSVASMLMKPIYPIPPWDLRDCFGDRSNNTQQLRNVGLRRSNTRCEPCGADESAVWTKAWYGAYAWSCYSTGCVLGQNHSEQNNISICMGCPPGTWGTSAMLCEPCSVGSYSSQVGSTACALCAAGWIANSTRSIKCIACQPGSEAPFEGSTTCRLCHPGTHTPTAGSDHCSLCPKGRVENHSGMSQCFECEAGRYSQRDAKACAQCDVGKHQENAGQDGCVRCESGSECSHPGTVHPENLPNWFQYKQEDSELDNFGESTSGFAPCSSPGLCLAGSKCREGHTGLLCEICQPLYAAGPVASSDCRKCPAWSVNMFTGGFLLLILCIAAFILADWAIQGTMQTTAMSSSLMKLLFNYITTMSFMGIMLSKELTYRAMTDAEADPSALADGGTVSELARLVSMGFVEELLMLFNVDCFVMPHVPDAWINRIKDIANAGHYAYASAIYREEREYLQDFHVKIEQRRLGLWFALPFLVCALVFIFGFVYVMILLCRKEVFFDKVDDFIQETKHSGWNLAIKSCSSQEYHAYMKAYSHRTLGIWKVATLAQKRGRKFLIAFRQQGEPLLVVINFMLFPPMLRAFLRPLSCKEPLGAGETSIG
jgi:ABC-type branched-subunit amino acid transport system substrate-binding protein